MSKVKEQNISVIANQVYAPGANETDLLPALLNIKSKPARIIVLSGSTEEGVGLLRKAKEIEMVGPDWVWIMPDAAASYFDVLNRESKADRDITNGLLYVFPRENGGNEEYNSFLATWTRAYPTQAPVAYTMLFIDCMYAVARGLLQVNLFLLKNF
jgi:ABC-type branched-subunit amino acid transport system substrate-binding protein